MVRVDAIITTLKQCIPHTGGSTNLPEKAIVLENIGYYFIL